LNNLYVSDSSAKAVYQFNPITGALRTLAVGTLVSPKGLAIDPSGNLLIADSGAPAIYRFNLQTGVRTTVATTATAPAAVVTDAAGNLLIADAASILAVPASSHSAAFTVASLAPAALAIDSAGNLFTGSGAAVLKLTRSQAYYQFAGGEAPKTVSLLDSGNQALNISSVGQTDTADYSLAATASTDCTLNATLPSTLVAGGACVLTASYTPTTFLTTTDTATFNGNAANASPVQLVLTGPTAPPSTTTVVNSIVPAAPVYGQTVTISARIDPSIWPNNGISPAPLGTVVFSVDGTPMAGVSVSASSATTGVATTTVSGLSAGYHTVRAVYASNNGFTSSTSADASVQVNQAPLTVTANNTSRAVGAANPAFTASYSGFVNGDTAAVLGGAPSLTTTATTSSAAGLYPITVSQGTLTAANYSFVFVNGTLSVVAAPTVVLTTTATLAKVSGGYQATVKVTNTGTAPAANVQLTAATLGSATGSPLPLSMGTLAAGGGSATVTITFPLSAGADGAATVERYTGSWTVGSFVASMRVVLP